MLNERQHFTAYVSKAVILLSAETVWKVAGLVVFGIELEAADGGLY